MVTKKELERKMEKARERHNAERSAFSKMRMQHCSNVFSNVSWRNIVRHDGKRKDV